MTLTSPCRVFLSVFHGLITVTVSESVLFDIPHYTELLLKIIQTKLNLIVSSFFA